MSEDKLLPCPFCGSAAKLERVHEYGGFTSGVSCDCMRDHEPAFNASPSPEKAIAAWNARAPDPRFAALVEACEDVLARHPAGEMTVNIPAMLALRAALAAVKEPGP